MSNAVCAVIVTYNRKSKLLECLTRLQHSSEPPEAVLVVDNASTDGTLEAVRAHFPQVQVLALPLNAGGAGGFRAGMRAAYARGHEYVWLFDDDAYVDERCLERLLAHARTADVTVPLQLDQANRKYGVYRWRNRLIEVDKDDDRAFPIDIFAFVGPLIHRRVIERVGYPRADFFICADDMEYALRIASAGFQVVCVPGAIFYHDYGGNTVPVTRFGRKSDRSTQPAWKKYYAVRNEILIARDIRASRAQRLSVLLGIASRFGRAAVGELVYEPDFLQRWKYALIGLMDGALNRTGKRVTPKVAR